MATFCRKSVVPAALLLLSFGGVSTAFAQSNEVSLGLSDVRDRDDQFIGIAYTRYLAPVQNDSTPYSIAPYLQKVDRVNGRYFGLGDMDRFELGGQWFIGDKWHLIGNARYIDSDGLSDEDYKSADLRLGYFLAPNWEIGAGILYEHYKDLSYFVREDGSVRSDTVSDSDISPSIFTRYTQITQGSGWDLSAQASFSDRDSFAASAKYYFNPELSLFSTYTFINDGNYFDDDTSVLEVGVDYWFTRSFSMQFGLGKQLDRGEGIGSITLLMSYRF